VRGLTGSKESQVAGDLGGHRLKLLCSSKFNIYRCNLTKIPTHLVVAV